MPKWGRRRADDSKFLVLQTTGYFTLQAGLNAFWSTTLYEVFGRYDLSQMNFRLPVCDMNMSCYATCISVSTKLRPLTLKRRGLLLRQSVVKKPSNRTHQTHQLTQQHQSSRRKRRFKYCLEDPTKERKITARQENNAQNCRDCYHHSWIHPC